MSTASFSLVENASASSGERTVGGHSVDDETFLAREAEALALTLREAGQPMTAQLHRLLGLNGSADAPAVLDGLRDLEPSDRVQAIHAMHDLRFQLRQVFFRGPKPGDRS
ncbi:MAG: hypothetical protein PHW10_04145 [Candidatus Peribacteraceae bacterium]|nr:hypothetical protein [Candidatus Peribacteraceae bacterium]